MTFDSVLYSILIWKLNMYELDKWRRSRLKISGASRLQGW